MIHQARPWLSGALFVGLVALPAQAEPEGDVDRLMDLMRFGETVAIMRLEGLQYGVDVGRSLLPDADPEDWAAVVSDIYDAEKMMALISADFHAELDPGKIGPMLDFFDSETGRAIIGNELEARRAFLDRTAEAEAIAAFQKLPTENARLAGQIEGIIDDSDLIEFNVMGTLNSSLMFYRGLSEGDGYDLTEDEIFADVWSTEEETRQSSQEWLGAFMTLAYQPLDPDQIDDYAAFYRTPEGQELNRAIFATFDRMYEEISYLLGLSLAKHMNSTPL